MELSLSLANILYPALELEIIKQANITIILVLMLGIMLLNDDKA